MQVPHVNKILLLRKHNDHHGRLTFLNGQRDLVRTCKFNGKEVRQMLQSSTVCFMPRNNSPFILILLFFPDQGYNSSFSCYCEDLQEKGHTWKMTISLLVNWSRWGMLWERTSHGQNEGSGPSPCFFSAVKPYIFPMIKLVHTTIPSLPTSPWLLPSAQLCWAHYSKICSGPQSFPCILICHTNSFPPNGSVGSGRVFVRGSIWTPALK